MDLKKIVPRDKKGGIVTSTIYGVGGLIIGVIVILVVVSTLMNANLLGSSTENTTAVDLGNNFTSGINNVASKIPTILLIVAVVFLFGALVLLIRNTNLMGVGGGGSL